MNPPRSNLVSVEPLAQFVERVLDREARMGRPGFEPVLADRMGVGRRTLWTWLNRDCDWVRVRTAEDALWRIGVPISDVYPDLPCPEACGPDGWCLRCGERVSASLSGRCLWCGCRVVDPERVERMAAGTQRVLDLAADGLPVVEIARRVGRSELAVQQQLLRARPRREAA